MKLGNLEFWLLTDGTFRLDGGAMFGVIPKPMWEKKAPADARNRIAMAMNSFLVYAGGKRILIETGAGDKHNDKFRDIYALDGPNLLDSLRHYGCQPDDIDIVVNTHLHFDHCGGNPLLGAIPVYVQGAELDAARRTPDYTLPELIENSRFEPVTGQVEVLAGVFLMPTPGHTGGHQSLIVRRADGAVILAGQSHDTATQYAADQLSWRAHRDSHSQPLPDIPNWIDALQQLDPRIVYFAHDRSVWTP